MKAPDTYVIGIVLALGTHIVGLYFNFLYVNGLFPLEIVSYLKPGKSI